MFVAGSLFDKVEIFVLQPLRSRCIQFSFSYTFSFSWPTMNSNNDGIFANFNELKEEAIISRKTAKSGFTF